MQSKVVATYERESTLWKNANFFYKLRDWTEMRCIVYDYSKEIADIKELGIQWFDINGNDVTASETERRYGKPFSVELTNKTGTNTKAFSFATKEEANEFVKGILKDKILGNFKRV